MAGFKKTVRDSIHIELQVGSTSELVEVQAETPLLSAPESSFGQVVNSRRVLELPSFGNSRMVLVQLAPGVMNATDMWPATTWKFLVSAGSMRLSYGRRPWPATRCIRP
jgi:hypothetical protein